MGYRNKPYMRQIDYELDRPFFVKGSFDDKGSSIDKQFCPASDKQVALMTKNGMKFTIKTTKRQASDIIKNFAALNGWKKK